MTDSNTLEISPAIVGVNSETGSGSTAAEIAGQNAKPSPGNQLQAARLAADMSAAELARRLCMTEVKLGHLERDEYDRLPGLIYVRGYLRNACKELRIESTPLLDALNACAGTEQPNQAPRAKVPRDSVMSERKSGGRGARRLGALAMALSVTVAFWWFNGRQIAPPEFVRASSEAFLDQAGTVSALTETARLQVSGAASGVEVDQQDIELESPSAREYIAEVDATDEEPVGGSAADMLNEAAAESVGLANETAETPSDASIPAPNEGGPVDPELATPGQQAEDESPLALAFSEDAWIEVVDASGATLMAKLQPAGSSVQLNGQAPFQLMLGNAAATTVSYRGTEVESGPLGNRRTRKLSVGGG